MAARTRSAAKSRSGSARPKRAAAAKSEPETLYTIGYEKRTQEEFFSLLAGAGISVLMDVRDVAWSHKPGFSKGTLAESAATAGLHYEHAQFAGNPKALRVKESETAGLIGAYEGHLDRHPEILEEFTKRVRAHTEEGKRVCIMCFERDPAECHRGVLAARWKRRRKGRVEHLGTV